MEHKYRLGNVVMWQFNGRALIGRIIGFLLQEGRDVQYYVEYVEEKVFITEEIISAVYIELSESEARYKEALEMNAIIRGIMPDAIRVSPGEEKSGKGKIKNATRRRGLFADRLQRSKKNARNNLVKVQEEKLLETK